MMGPEAVSTPSASNSSGYYEPDDPDFLVALQDTILPGDIPPTVHSPMLDLKSDAGPSHNRPSLKRPLSPIDEPERPSSISYQITVDDDTYGPSHFGQFGEYMRRKRAKLQIQNSQISEVMHEKSKIFAGLAIYINGWTEPSVQDLRHLIIQHGGIFHAYLDRKSSVTHIITCSLTPAKVREFKSMKVVRPEWLVESAEAGALLPWVDYIFRAGDRMDQIEGASTAQKSLLNTDIPPSRPRMLTNVLGQSYSMTPTTSSDLFSGPNSTPHIPLDPKLQTLKPEALQSTSSTLPRPALNIIHSTDPKDSVHVTRVPEYAAHKSNPNAERAMANQDWRSAHTSVAPDFIDGYYKNSRLHHLSTWKSELRNLVIEAQERLETSTVGAGVDTTTNDSVSMRGAELTMKSPFKGKGRAKAVESDDEKVIMHCDFDCFFVSAGLVSRPHLRGKPVVVCHSQGAQGGGASTSEIASASYEAREFGIKNGMSLQQARKLCPLIITIPYEFERYKQLSLQFYTILMSHADDLQAVSVDEALIDVTNSVAQFRAESSTIDPAIDFAETLRAEIRKATGCEVSIGVSHNILLARLATRRAKPAASYHLLSAHVPEFLAPLDIVDLHGFGRSVKEKALDKFGATKLGELVSKSKAVLCDALGKGTGETLYKAIRGIDDRKLESDKPRKSVSCEINYGIRFENNDQVEAFVYGMGEKLAERLNQIDKIGHSISLKIMKRDPTAPFEAPKFLGHGACDIFSKQMPLDGPGGRATSDPKVIGEHAWRLLESFNFDPKELRGIGIHINKLESSSAASGIDSGQTKLLFKPLESPKKICQDPGPSNLEDVVHSLTPPRPVSRSPSRVELPSFSQVDMNVFNALPEDVRQELEAEYKHRSISPALIEPHPPPWPAKASPSATSRSRITIKGTNVKRITQQLAPRNRPSVSPRNIFAKKNLLRVRRSIAPEVTVSEAELYKLKIDPEVFALLPEEVQREQLAGARLATASGLTSLAVGTRQIIKAYKRSPSAYRWRRPPPMARHPQPAFLKQRGKAKGEKLYFTETDDVQRVIEKWVDGFREQPPNQKDIDYFTKFLVESVDSSRSTDSGVEKAVKVVKWWLILLRRNWGIWERSVDEGKGQETGIASEVVGRAWWKAFREVKQQMDVVARKKFGGRLSLK